MTSLSVTGQNITTGVAVSSVEQTEWLGYSNQAVSLADAWAEYEEEAGGAPHQDGGLGGGGR